ncbi:MAG: hypothetical protein WCC64_06005 [Aliidongia sp.]
MKDNQPNLLETVRTITDTGRPTDTAFSRDKGRSRQEDRTVDVFPVGEALAATEWQPFVKTIIRALETRQDAMRLGRNDLANVTSRSAQQAWRENFRARE